MNRLAVVTLIVLSILVVACGCAGSSSVKAIPREEFKHSLRARLRPRSWLLLALPTKQA